MSQDDSLYDVFLSYSHKDAEDYGMDLIQSIKKEIEDDLYDITCRPLVFLDSDALECGDEWHARIIEKLNECRVFICLLSENYLESSYCTRERLWWEAREIRRGRLRQATLPVYFISLNNDPYQDERLQVRDLFGFQMEIVEGKLKPWFDRGREEVKDVLLKDRIDNLKKAVQKKLALEEAAKGFNTVFPDPSPYFVGRILELKQLREICADNQYPIIEGKAGVGKSELATVYSYGYAEEYPQGRFLIHMEGIRSWEDAVVSLVSDPDNGMMVRTELKITDEDMRRGEKYLHRVIIDRLFARALNGRLLLLLDNVDDASLFNERKLRDFSLKRPIPDNIHMIATTRHELEFPKERHRAKAFPIGNLDDDASFELFCEIGQNRFPFCKKAELNKNDPEYKAAMEIIRQMKGHVWSLEIIAGQVADNYGSGATFQAKLDSLRDCFSVEGDGISWRSPADNPADLVRQTLDILKKMENGDVILRMVYFAALLPPDGKKRDILRVCWDKLFPHVQFTDKSLNAFLHAYSHLWRYNLIHGRDDDKMHRLTQTGLKQIMKEDGVFDDCVKELADVMAETFLFSNRTCTDTISATPEIAEILKDSHPAFFSNLLSPEAWVRLLSADPHQPILTGLCPWNMLGGKEWRSLLVEHPEAFTDKCDWNRLTSRDWRCILRERPELNAHCDWDKLGIQDWGDILYEHPEFVDKREKDEMDGYEWRNLLRVRPEYETECPWDKLSGDDWMVLLEDQPQLGKYCDWDKLGGMNWALLLSKRPEFSDYCRWDELSGNDWMFLLPKFIEKCAWNRLNGQNWRCILRDKLDNPEIEKRCPWDKLSGQNWAELLNDRPEFSERCDWNKLTGRDWALLLGKQPRFTKFCDWNKLDDDDWKKLLKECPIYLEHCPDNMLDGQKWAIILREHPKYADVCKWDRLNGKNWASLLSKQPQFAGRCPWDKLSGNDWAWLLGFQPQFAGRCPWDALGSNAWMILLVHQPQFAEKCPPDKLDGNDWAWLLGLQPQLANQCPWEKLTVRNMADLLIKQPQLLYVCDLKKLKQDDPE